MKTIRCIALDMDRTTLESDKSLSWGNRAALCDMVARGIHVVIASGRPYDALPEAVTEIPGIEYAITSNGAAVYHLPSGKRLKGYVLTSSSVEAVLKLVQEKRWIEDGLIILEGFVEGKAYADARYVENPRAYGASEIAARYLLATRRPVKVMEAFLREHKEELDSVDLVIRDTSRKTEILTALNENVKDIYITSSIPELIEISNQDAGKHAGLHFLMDYLNLDADEIAAFGDAENDIEMLELAGYGIAVANATEDCKASADYVSKAFDEDGVAYGIYHYLPLPDYLPGDAPRSDSKQMCKIALHISSLSGNTRKLANAVCEYFFVKGYQVDVYDQYLMPTDKQDDYDVHIVAFWCRRSFMDDKTLLRLSQLIGQKIYVIGTLGYYPVSPYADTLKARIEELVNEKNTHLGTFLSHGKIAKERTERRRNLPKDSKHYLSDEGYQRHLESRKHPNKEDLYDAIRFFRAKGF